VDAARDLADFEAEIGLLDALVLSGRVERLQKEGKRTRELEVLEDTLGRLNDGEIPARILGLDAQAITTLSGFQLLGQKPQLALLSLHDDVTKEEADALESSLRAAAEARSIAVMALRPNIENEIAQLGPDDQQAFLADLGLSETARARFIRACYAMLNLISFFTVGEDEVRAWTIRRGTPAVRAAGKIHSDLERGFIRAETVSYDDFMLAGKLSRARETGKLRLEGKDYVVEDGDILNIRFNV
jgi:ribosome-binding ATPase YchF (GTP1/OBG family)